MTVPTPPAVSEAMRDAVAQAPASLTDHLKEVASMFGSMGFHAAASTIRSAISEIARLTGERDAHKARGDNHAETLRGVSQWIQSGDTERALLWISDGLSGYVETAQAYLIQEVVRREAAEAETARLRAALKDVEGKCELARSVYATEETATPSRAAEAFAIVRNVARAALTSQEKTDV